MIFQLSDWFPKPMIWTIIVKFDQIRKNWWQISCAEILEVGKDFFAASSVKKMTRFEEVSPEDIKRIAWIFTKTVIPLGLAGYELVYITNEAVGRVGYYQLISCKFERNNCFSKFSSNSLDVFGRNLLKSCHLPTTPRKNPTSKISAQEICHQFFLIWSNLTIMAHIMGLGNQSESWKIIILS